MLLLLLDLIGIAYWLSGVKLSITSSSTVVSSSFSSFLTGLVEPLHLSANLISDPISGQNLIWKMSKCKIWLVEFVICKPLWSWSTVRRASTARGTISEWPSCSLLSRRRTRHPRWPDPVHSRRHCQLSHPTEMRMFIFSECYDLRWITGRRPLIISC
jgi:hypothetical protein